jgi:hypothetical protein
MLDETGQSTVQEEEVSAAHAQQYQDPSSCTWERLAKLFMSQATVQGRLDLMFTHP